MALAELNRIHSHLVWLGTSALELGAISLFWYCFDDRDQILDLFEMAGGTRMHTRYVQVGGIAEDLPPDFTREARKFCDAMPKSVDEYEAILDRNAIWLERTVGVGLLSVDDALALAQSGPMLRSTGVDWDLRRDMPYLAYDEVDFDVPCMAAATCMTATACTWTRCANPFASSASASTGSTRPTASLDRGRPQGRAPARHELHTSMESLIHHFKIVTRASRCPRRGLRRHRVATRRERLLPRLGWWREAVAREFRAPSFAALQATATIVQGLLIADSIAAGGSLDPVMGDADR